MRDYTLLWNRGFTLMRQYDYVNALRNSGYDIDWDVSVRDGGHGYSFMIDEENEAKIYLEQNSEAMKTLGMDAPLLLLGSCQTEYSDMCSILQMKPMSNNIRQLQEKLFKDDPQAEDKMIVVLERLNKEFTQHLRKRGFEIGFPVPGTVEIDRSGYRARYYRVYPIYLKNVKPLIPLS
jgi:hypothetical protein